MRSFFGTPWENLSVEAVEEFLADAGDEGLTWEAKGTQEPHRDAVRKAVSGFANAAGGFFIVGAERRESGWTLPGVEFGADEPGTWLSSVIAQGLHPVPPFDVAVFERADDRRAAVVAVEPLAVPPCVTANGVVFQRVSGQTLPVTDQRVLAELMSRGRAARNGAEGLALRAAVRALDEPAMHTADDALFSVALAPVPSADDKARTLFSEAFVSRITAEVQRRLQPEFGLSYSVAFDVHQDCVRFAPASRELGRSWTAAAYWDGSVSAVFAAPSDELYVQELIAGVHRAWNVLVDIAATLGGVGDAHLVVNVRADHPAVAAKRFAPTTPTRRWTTLDQPSEEELASVERELLRGFGQSAWEPSS